MYRLKISMSWAQMWSDFIINIHQIAEWTIFECNFRQKFKKYSIELLKIFINARLDAT